MPSNTALLHEVNYRRATLVTEARPSMPTINTECSRLIAEVGVPGIASAVIRNARLDRYLCCGVRGVQAPTPIDEDTVFDAASLGKPVFAHVALQLVDQGRLSLDAPLVTYLPGYLPGDERASLITARHVLSHSTGLPNWRNADLPLKTYFQPGERFSYSGEGFLFLQRVVEAITGETIDTLAEQLVLRPFAMARSSFVWDWRFEPNRAYPHDDFGNPAVGGKPAEANAAATLQTTAADYARFLLCVLDGARLQPETAQLWFRPQIEVRHPGPQCLGSSGENVVTGISWGLGWGLEQGEGTFFHWGNNGAFKAFTLGSTQSKDALVFFMNGASGLAIMPALVAALVPGDRPSLAWLNYGRHDSPVRCLLRAARERGAAAVWTEIAAAKLDAGDLLWIARGLSAAGLDTDANWLRERIKQYEAAGRSSPP
jgi:CubicO group peptidase (beta-lactamase class C family)